MAAYKNTHATTKEAPAILLLNHKIRTLLDLLKPSFSPRRFSSYNTKLREFRVDDTVLVCDCRKGEIWTPGVVLSKTGLVFYCSCSVLAKDIGIVRSL